MAIINGYRISDKRASIISYIFDYRGVTAEHLLYLMYPDRFKLYSLKEIPNRKQPSPLKNLYADLKELEKKGLMMSESLPDSERTSARKVYFLSRAGLEVALELFDVAPNHIGVGFGGDRGDFNFDQYKPPIGRHKHHFLLVELFIALSELSKKHSKLQIDYRDNRYAAERYTIMNDDKPKTSVFRPDGEILIDGKNYLIEIDRGTEFTNELNSKWAGYDQYFNYLVEQGRPLPEGILWISEKTNNSLKRRWNLSVMPTFFNRLGKWASKVNLIAGSLENIEKMVMCEHLQEEQFDWIVRHMPTYFKNDKYKGTNLSGVEVDTAAKLNFNAVFSITQVTNDHQLFLYVRVNGFETKGIAQANDFKKWILHSGVKEFSSVTEIIPILYYYDQTLYPLSFDGIDYQKTLEEVFVSPYWLHVTKVEPKWTDHDGEPYLKHPLLSRIPAST